MFLHCLQKFTNYYMPWWTSLILAIVPICVAHAIEQARRTNEASSAESVASRTTADLDFGMLPFWLWAIITNARDRRLVRSGGLVGGTVEARSEEIGLVLLFGSLTAIVFVLSKAGLLCGWVDVSLVVLVCVLPLVVLGIPERARHAKR